MINYEKQIHLNHMFSDNLEVEDLIKLTNHVILKIKRRTQAMSQWHVNLKQMYSLTNYPR